MKDNFESCLKAVLHHEGGFVNHPKDPGGMTNLGVTKKVWEEYVGHEVDVACLRQIAQHYRAFLFGVQNVHHRTATSLERPAAGQH